MSICAKKINQLNRLRYLLYNYANCTEPSRVFHLSAVHEKRKRSPKKLLEIDPLRDLRSELYEKKKSKKEIQFIKVYGEENSNYVDDSDSKHQLDHNSKVQSSSEDCFSEIEQSSLKPSNSSTTLTQSISCISLSKSPECEVAVELLKSEAVSEPVSDDNTPVNILGDLDAILGSDLSPEDIPLTEMESFEALQSVDYNVYITPWQGQRNIYPELPLDNMMEGFKGIPLNHIVQFIRDTSCFDTEIIETAPGMFVQYVIITSVSSSKHLRTIRSTFPKLCRDEYNMAGYFDTTTKSRVWLAYDTGPYLLHFLTYDKRVELNLESLWLGQDEEEKTGEEETYTSNLLQGLFPDEDITKLAKPFELIRDKDN